MMRTPPLRPTSNAASPEALRPAGAACLLCFMPVAMRPALLCAALVLFAGCAASRPAAAPPPPGPRPHDNLNATVWMQTAVEYRANALALYRAATSLLPAALADTAWSADVPQLQRGGFGRLPAAVVLDLDETVLDNSPAQARRVAVDSAYSQKAWGVWTASASARAIPGALAYTQAAHARGIRVVYITNRTAAEEADTRRNLAALGFPLDADEDGVLTRGERPAWAASDKGPRRADVAARYRILQLVGDNLGDVLSGEDAAVAARDALVAPYDAFWGTRWFLLPNPTYGSWESAITRGAARRTRRQARRPPAAVGRSLPPPPTPRTRVTPLRIGILGYGAFGRFLHGAWADLPGVAVVAVATQEPGAAPPGVRAYAAWQEALAAGGFDLAAIALPPVMHADVAVAAMEAGFHVLIEKPVATTLADAERIAAAQQRTGRVAGVNYLMRFNPIVEALHAWCRSGAFGPLRRVVVENYAQDETLAPDHWFWDRAQSGGILVEHSVHFIDVVHGCDPGAPVQVQGGAVRRAGGQEDRVLMNVLYARGLAMTQYHSFARPNFFEETTLRFVFDLAELRWEGWIPMQGTVRALTTDAGEAALRLLPGFAETARTSLSDAPLRSGGIEYRPTADVRGPFALPISKADAYTAAVCALLLDVKAAIETPGHRLRAGLPEALASLQVALAAANDTAPVVEPG